MLPDFTFTTINIGPVTLHTWGVFAGIAFAAALFIALKEAKRKNIDEDRILDLAILILVGGVIGARLLFVAENWSFYSENINQIISLNEGGLMFYGGVLGAAAAFFLYLIYVNGVLVREKKEKISLMNIADTLAPSFAIGELVGRIGCVLGDIHIGEITTLPWGQKYIDGSIRHPVAIYMALNGLFMLVALCFLRLRIKTKSALFLLFVLWYSGTRFFLDFLRCSDLEVCDPHYAGFTPSQYISVLIFLIALIFLIKKTKFMEELKKQPSENPEHKTAEKSVSGEIVLGAEGQNEEINESKKTLFLPGNQYWKCVIVVIVAFTLGAGLLSGYYERFFKKDMFSFRGKTWVSYDKPIINLTIVNDADCKECSTEDIVKQLKAGIMPTLAVKEVDYNSKEGKDTIGKFSVKSLPAFIFDSGVEKLDNFTDLSKVLTNKDGQYFLNSVAVGIKPGKFLETLQVLPTDRVQGSADAPVTIIEFSDFQCPYCKKASEVLKEVLAVYPNKIRFAYKEFPLIQIHQNAQPAAMAAECAGDQGKFWEMHDMLFGNQDKLDKDSLAKYANRLKLNIADFNNCLSSEKNKAKIEADSKLAADFGVSGTPAFFVNGQLMNTDPTLENFKALIDPILAAK